jgi:hypothetical protein
MFAEDIDSWNSWLVPWLNLIPQLPLAALDRATTFMGGCLTIGSPMLAGYNLARTAIHTRWINTVFKELLVTVQSSTSHRRTELQQSITSLRIFLIESQHTALSVTMVPIPVLASILSDVRYHEYWKILEKNVSKSKTSQAPSLKWQWSVAVVAQIFCILAFFISGNDENLLLVGLAINSLWSYLLPLVWGWVVVGTHQSTDSMSKALKDTREYFEERGEVELIPSVFNDMSYTSRILKSGTDEENSAEGESIGQSAPSNHRYSSATGWMNVAGAPFSFARFSTHMRVVEKVRAALWLAVDLASPARERQTSDATLVKHLDLEKGAPDLVDETPVLERDTLVTGFGIPDSQPVGTSSRFLIATVVGLVLAWSSTGSAILIAYM